MSSERKPLALAILAQAKGDKGEASDAGDSGSAEEAAFSELTDALGIIPRDEEGARTAFIDLVRAAVAKSKASKYEE